MPSRTNHLIAAGVSLFLGALGIFKYRKNLAGEEKDKKDSKDHLFFLMGAIIFACILPGLLGLRRLKSRS